MRYFVDTGVLLRMASPHDPQHEVIEAALGSLRERGITISCGLQNIAEFWNVSTRPTTARGGLGQLPHEARKRLAMIELLVEVLPESRAVFPIWKRLLYEHDVKGVQVYDCRIAAIMATYEVSDILTLNPDDFRRYPGLRVHTPASVIAAV